MMKTKFLPLLLVVLCTACAKTEMHVSDAQVQADLKARQEAINAPEYFSILDTDLSPEQRQCLEFLYAYTPLPDVTDYPGEYFLENVDLALQAREEMPWGKTVPDREFRHFVLPPRVNNENLDEHRRVFYNELKPRIEGLSMADAILEVNHWCHEKATYEPSDGRTHSPLATVSSAIGRCGEESTFAVAALRSVGIPARQVYTPRWAHTDDNHAWVEAWADGEWHFLGACEPEAQLDLGWFNAPASRGMLMNTRTLGHYDGPEEKLLETPMYTDINVTANYAPVDTLWAIVVDSIGNFIRDAVVDFRLYNYAELYPIATKRTDAEGRASIVAGKGDLIVWATTPDGYAFEKATVGQDKTVELQILPGSKPASLQIDITPPAQSGSLPQVAPEAKARNAERLAQEDSIRNAYIATFVDKSRGHRAVLDQFLSSLPDERKAQGQAMLDYVTNKDWTDIPIEVLNDAMLLEVPNEPTYNRWALSPRIENEHLKPFRAEFYQTFSDSLRRTFQTQPELWEDWVAANIQADQQWQPSTVRMSPASVMKLKRTDAPSRNIFFVAGARAMGIPAYIDPVNGMPKYIDQQGREREATKVQPSQNAQEGSVSKGLVQLDYKKTGHITDPAYYTHFTLSHIADGCPQLLNYDEGATWSKDFKRPIALETGQNMLVTGQRLANGSVLAQVDFFDVKDNGTTHVPLNIRQATDEVQVIGNFNSENLYYDLATEAQRSILSTTGRGYYILGIVANNHEPSNHALRDIIALRSELEANGTPMLILFSTPYEARANQLAPQLPTTAHLGAEAESGIAQEIITGMELDPNAAPIFIIADTFNRVVFVTSGYTIGLGQQLIDTLSRL
ncbi:MAG: transglutaminase domain-containing protein [Bacteroidales bacterium]|nr:transglutaminase domain-containing protein [Bacteroidales bacterium]